MRRKSAELVAFCFLISSAIFLGHACKGPSENPDSDSHSGQSAYTGPLTIIVGDKHGYIDRSGKVVVPPQFNSANDFSDGLALVCLGDCNPFRRTKADGSKYGFVEGNGHFAVNPQYDRAESFSEGLAAVCLGDCGYEDDGSRKWGFVDKQGNVVIPPQFGAANPFVEGLAGACVGKCVGYTGNVEGKWGFIDKTGKFAIRPQFDEAYNFQAGVAQVRIGHGTEERIGYIDRTGKFIWNPTNQVSRQFGTSQFRLRCWALQQSAPWFSATLPRSHNGGSASRHKGRQCSGQPSMFLQLGRTGLHRLRGRRCDLS